MFKVIDEKFTFIFNKTKQVNAALSTSVEELNKYVCVFNRLNSQQNFGNRWQHFLNGMNNLDPNLGAYFENLAKQGASALANIQGMYAAMLDGNTHGIQNVRAVISTFNSVDPQNQQAFASAVGQTNSRLGIYLANLNGANASLQGYGAQLAATTAKTVALRIASMALNTVISMGFSLVISTVIGWISSWINAQQEAIDKAKELSQEYKEHCDTLKSLREEYLNIIESTKSVSDKDKELIEWKKKLVEQYGFEKEALKGINAERQTGIELLDEELYKSARKAVNDLEKDDVAQEAMMKYYGLIDTQKQKEGYYGGQYRDAINSISFFGFANAWGEKDASEYVHSLINGIEDEIKGVNVTGISENLGVIRVENFGINLNADDAQDAFDKIDQLLTSLKKKREGLVFQGKDSEVNILDRIIKTVENKRGDIQKIIDENQEIVSQYLSSQAQMIYADYAKGLNSVQSVTEETYLTWRDGLLAMAGESEPLRKALAKIADETFPQFAKSGDDTAEGVNSKYIPSVQKLTDAYKDLEEQIERILDLQSKLSDAFEKVASGEVFTAEEAYNLVKEIPELYKSITPVEGGFSFSLDGLESAYKAQNEELINQIKENSKENQKVIDYYNEQKNKLDGLQSDTTASTGIRGFNALEADTKTSGYSEDMTVLKQSADEASEIIKQNNALINILNGSLESHSMKLEGITTQYETARDKIDDYNRHVETIDKAISSLNENNALTYDEMAALVEISPALKNAFTEQGNGYYIAIDSLELLKEQSYTTRDSYIDDLIAMAEAEITSAEATKKALGDKINSWDSYISYTTEIAEVSAEISGWQDLIDKLTALRGKVYETDSSSSSGEDTISDKLQQEIDYYDKIIQGIEAVTDKRIEAIDKEIDAINEQKDALKEQNDERQRELDLIEAQNNLDKAKKQKVFVYKEGQGLVQVQDEKAVKDAQKELDDAQREIKEAEYDKQIDLLEQQSKATEEYRDTFSDMKSDIEDAIAVEQAKSALGTDEKGLLSLDISAINGIQNGLAKAVVEKENEDNKGNPYHKDVTWADLMKKLGSNATMEEFKAKVYDPMMNSFSPEKLYNIQGGSNNQYITNNSPTTFTATFNITGATDPNEVAKVVRTEITDLLQRTYNKIK